MGIFDWFTKKKRKSSSRTPVRRAAAPLEGNFDPGSSAIQIAYKNFAGEMKSFTGDVRTLYSVGRHVVFRAVPTGRYISLKLASIQNRSEVESQLDKYPLPTANERRILNYHRKHKTSSQLYEQLLQDYPNYFPR
jgi:hypothetical protein